jgi:hypothetical protein
MPKHFRQDRPEPRVANPSTGFCYFRETRLPLERPFSPCSQEKIRLGCVGIPVA